MADPVPIPTPSPSASSPSPAPPAATPPADVLAGALRHAAAVRIAAYRQDERYAHYTLAALRERVVTVPLPPRPHGGGWWSAGRLLDDLGGAEWRVWVHPERRRLRLIPRPVLEPRIPVPARHPDGRYYDGARRRWLLPNGEPVAADASESPAPA